MKQALSGLNLLTLLTLTGGLILIANPAWADQRIGDGTLVVETISASPPPSEPDTTVIYGQAQIEASSVQITDIRVESAEDGLQVIIEADGAIAPPTQSVSGNALVLTIPNATLVEELKDEGVQVFEPAEGIALVQATALSGNGVQVVITGNDAVPEVNISTEAAGLAIAVTPGIAQVGANDDEAIQLAVTGEEGSRYVAPNATTATRTDTPIRDIPQSIQVIPREVLEDQQIIRLDDALRNVSGVTTNGVDASRGFLFNVRGFDNALVLRNGFRAFEAATAFPELGNIERIEVLKGPSSILFGQIEPSGVINLVTKRPLSEPTYRVAAQVGRRDLISPSIDFSGPITNDGRLLYRL
ncbi:MAG: TonB-dependent receptor plug domain-containing protein, partial [Cyanobacteria bacterium P01_H01_bin.130]